MEDMLPCRQALMDPIVLATCLAMTLAGCLMGTFSGIVPGIHVNTLASMMLASYPVLEGALPLDAANAAVAVSCCVMSASIVHSFVDFVPSVFIGAPDEEDAVSVLPGHRLLKEGRGMEAVRAAAIGSLIGCSASILMAVPLQWALAGGAGEFLDRLTPVVLLAACFAVLYGEWIRGSGLWGPAAFLISGTLGYCCMTVPIPQNGIIGDGSIMMPLLTGLFGIPVMLEASKGSGTPPQTDRVKDPVGPMPGLRGVVMGTLAGWFPGITSSVGAAMSAAVLPENRPERFISTVASIGTVTSVLALVTLSASGNGRSGTALVMKEILGDSIGGVASGAFLMLLLSTAVASALGYHITIACGRAFCRMSSRIDPRRLSRAVLILLIALTAVLAGPWGLIVLLCATAVGFIPSVCGTGRLVLCGCLILPVLIFKMLRSEKLGRRFGHELLDIDHEPLVGAGSYLPFGVAYRDREHEPPAIDLHELRLAGRRHPHGSGRRMSDVQMRPHGAGPLLQERRHALAGGLLDEGYHGRSGENRKVSASQCHGCIGLRDLDRPASFDSRVYHGKEDGDMGLNRSACDVSSAILTCIGYPRAWDWKMTSTTSFMSSESRYARKGGSPTEGCLRYARTKRCARWPCAFRPRRTTSRPSSEWARDSSTYTARTSSRLPGNTR